MLKQEALDGKSNMGRTLYIGSKKSDIYFCVYEKDYEQFIKEHIPIEEADVKNRFEIRLKNDRAFVALMDLMEFDDVQKIACEIINRYILFLEPDKQKEMDDWEIDLRWKHFIKDCSSKLKLTLQPEPYTLDRTYNWIGKQVAPSLSMLKKIDKIYDTSFIEQIEQVKLPVKQRKLLQHYTAHVMYIATEKGSRETVKKGSN